MAKKYKRSSKQKKPNKKKHPVVNGCDQFLNIQGDNMGDQSYQSYDEMNQQNSKAKVQTKKKTIRKRRPPDPSSPNKSSGGGLDLNNGGSSNQTKYTNQAQSIKGTLRPFKKYALNFLENCFNLASCGKLGQAVKKQAVRIFKRLNYCTIIQFIVFYQTIAKMFNIKSYWDLFFTNLLKYSSKSSHQNSLKGLQVGIHKFLETKNMLFIWNIGKTQHQGQCKPPNRSDLFQKLEVHYDKCKIKYSDWKFKVRYMPMK